MSLHLPQAEGACSNAGQARQHDAGPIHLGRHAPETPGPGLADALQFRTDLPPVLGHKPDGHLLLSHDLISLEQSCLYMRH